MRNFPAPISLPMDVLRLVDGSPLAAGLAVTADASSGDLSLPSAARPAISRNGPTHLLNNRLFTVAMLRLIAPPQAETTPRDHLGAERKGNPQAEEEDHPPSGHHRAVSSSRRGGRKYMGVHRRCWQSTDRPFWDDRRAFQNAVPKLADFFAAVHRTSTVLIQPGGAAGLGRPNTGPTVSFKGCVMKRGDCP